MKKGRSKTGVSSIYEPDWDLEVGLWLRDIPYIWQENPFEIISKEGLSGWRKYRRVYIVPSTGIQLTTFEQQYNISGYHFKMKKECDLSVIRYFMASISLNLNNLKHIRINGYPYTFHLYTHQGCVLLV
jgi:hypothetical protein